MIYFILGLVGIIIILAAAFFFSRQSIKRLKREAKAMKKRESFLEAELKRHEEWKKAWEEIHEETEEKKKRLHTGSNIDRANAATDVMRELSGSGGDPDPDPAA